MPWAVCHGSILRQRPSVTQPQVTIHVPTTEDRTSCRGPLRPCAFFGISAAPVFCHVNVSTRAYSYL